MTRSLVRTIVVAADADSVWAHIGNFGGLGEWHPAVPPAELEGDPTQVGSIRSFSVEGRVVARELLVARDPEARSYSYQVLDPMLPISDYVATLEVTPQGDKSEIRWSAEYKSEDDAVATVEQIFGDGVYVAGLQAVQAHFADA
ncbi:SRPBCC family protein [Prescottella agglutinans]|uniref:SRPBCC family protein n=1 Tax=Prescottella agglutinans TaxID=1644129 RepID=A0A3S3E981_9NOCA|nr:SRPBCC family protein [Prescottella agglutinans]RVW08641.1 SRPBCC family protein [Prescottella agglutinans]